MAVRAILAVAALQATWTELRGSSVEGEADGNDRNADQRGHHNLASTWRHQRNAGIRGGDFVEAGQDDEDPEHTRKNNCVGMTVRRQFR
jgi:hypothetical protein